MLALYGCCENFRTSTAKLVNLLNSSSTKVLTSFENNLAKSSFGDSFQRLFKSFRSFEKYGHQEGGFVGLLDIQTQVFISGEFTDTNEEA